jgi:hypothetical protein
MHVLTEMKYHRPGLQECASVDELLLLLHMLYMLCANTATPLLLLLLLVSPSPVPSSRALCWLRPAALHKWPAPAHMSGGPEHPDHLAGC